MPALPKEAQYSTYRLLMMMMKMNVSPSNSPSGHTLEAETMVNAVPVIQLQLYVNPVLHYLVPPALVTLLATRGVHRGRY